MHKLSTLALLAVALLLLVSCGQHDPFMSSFAAGDGDDPYSSSSDDGGGTGEVIGSCAGVDRGSRACVEILDNGGWNASVARQGCEENDGAWRAGSVCPAWYIYADSLIEEGGIIYYYPDAVPIPDVAALLEDGVLLEGSIAELGGEVWHKFAAAAGASYYVRWNDMYSPSESEDMADVFVDVYNGDGDLLFHGDDMDEVLPTVALEASGFVYVRVTRISEESGDGFSVAYGWLSGEEEEEDDEEML